MTKRFKPRVTISCSGHPARVDVSYRGHVLIDGLCLTPAKALKLSRDLVAAAEFAREGGK